ncbi:MAG: lysine exporter LysO family protein [Neisseria sp.]|uniref:lysine exporter LysO family protein n=1 Tax=Neisseria sp. TaxID=192066 RepID=UPI0026DD6A1E|nr:lysine exporter LysO family protein [Neisseria sp.]MDO4640876.1 lysine exporter LysO family protein [Neisseria sp.]
MQNLITLAMILTPLFIGYFIRLPKSCMVFTDRLLNVLIYVILTLIGVSLSQVRNLGSQIDFIAFMAVALAICVLGANLLILMWFDRKYPWQNHINHNGKKARIGIGGSIKQLACIFFGLAFGKLMSGIWLPPESTSTYALMLLILLVGIQLGGSSMTLRQVLLNRRGVQISLLLILSSFLGGILFCILAPDVSFGQALALSSGFGWYSLSGIVMTEAYGPVWGSIALLNDLIREFFALIFIPLIMRRYPSAAIGIGGATSMDFTLPVIQSAGGLAAVPLAISFGFIINLVAPFLMLVFSNL